MRILDTTLNAEKVQIDILRRMKPEQRLQIAVNLARTTRRLLMEGVRMRHPNYSEEQVRLATIRLILKDDLFLSAYPDAKDIVP